MPNICTRINDLRWSAEVCPFVAVTLNFFPGDIRDVRCKHAGMCQVGLGSSTTAEFLAKARNIVTQHRELQNQVEALRSQIGHLEMTQLRAVSQRDMRTRLLPISRS